MAYVPVSNCAQVEMVALMAGQRTQNVLHYTQTGMAAYNTAKLTALCNAIIALVNQTSVKALWPSTWQLIELRATDLTTQFSEAVTISAGLPITGTRPGSQLPNNCALCFTKRSTLRGRNFRGRFYFGPLVEADVTDNTVSGAVVTGIIGNLLNGLRVVTDANTVVHNLQIVSRWNNNVPRAAGLTTDVNNWTSDGIVDSQRRRLPGRGN